jgi:two-component system, OmpR family, response regulator
MASVAEKKKILIVDDQADFTAIIKYQLEMAGGYEVCAENRALHTLNTAHAFKPDIILLDIFMPDCDGMLIAAGLEVDAQLKSVPIVYYTSLVAHGELDENALHHPILSKKAELDELIACLEKYTGPKS